MLTFNYDFMLNEESETICEVVEFIKTYTSPSDEASYLKNIPNTPHSMKMIKLIRKYVNRELLGQNADCRVALRLKGRGPNRPKVTIYGNYTSHRDLNMESAERFSLYAHHDYIG